MLSVPSAPPALPTLALSLPPMPAALVEDPLGEAELIAALAQTHGAPDSDTATRLLQVAQSSGGALPGAALAMGLDVERLADVWATAKPEQWLIGDLAARLVLVRLGERALPGIEALVGQRLLGSGALVAVRAPWVALPMARALGPGSYEWLSTHRDLAIPTLLQVALAEPGLDGGPDRAMAEAALRWLARRDEGAALRAVATSLGAEVLAATDDLLSPLRGVPRSYAHALPKVFKTLPLRWRDGTALDAASMEALGRMLATPLPSNHPSMLDAMDRCDRSALCAAGQALFDAWVQGGMATQNLWIAHAHAVLGGDEAVRELGRSIRIWGRSREKHQRNVARAAIVALAEFEDPASLSELVTIAATARDEGVRAHAEQALTRKALETGVAVDDLATPMVEPAVTLDFGPRAFTTGIGAALQLELLDGAGRVIKALPRPTQKDDADKAKAAKALFEETREQLRDAVSSETKRLERAMIAERRWDPERFCARLATAPVARAVAQRILFGAWLEERFLCAFRVAEDLSLGSIDDDALVLPAGARVGVVHPLSMDAALLVRWQLLFASYELLSPFEQLQRKVYRDTSELADASLHPGAVMGLRERGWRLVHAHWPAISAISKASRRGHFTVQLDPGFRFDDLSNAERQKLSAQEAHGALTAIERSELVRDLLG